MWAWHSRICLPHTVWGKFEVSRTALTALRHPGVLGLLWPRLVSLKEECDVLSGASSLVDEARMDMDDEMRLNGVDDKMKKVKENFRFSASTRLFV